MADHEQHIDDTHSILKFTVKDSQATPQVVDLSSGVTSVEYVIRPKQNDEDTITMTFDDDGSDGIVNVRFTAGFLNVGDQEGRVKINWTSGKVSWQYTQFIIRGLT